jgi:succinoglycan biosynthesis transport protein ExoP
MNIIYFLKILLRNWLWLIVLPLLTTLLVIKLTKNMPKEYDSSTVLYTGVASGYSITTAENQKLDYFAVNNAFDNLLSTAKSRETLEQVAINLLTEHMLMKKPDIKVLSWEGFIKLKTIVSDSLHKAVQQIGDTAAAYQMLYNIYTSKADNPIAQILNKTGSYYSIDNIRSGLIVTRKSTSDMLEIDYSSNDAGVCLRTLELHSKIFISKYKGLKSTETNSAVAYFEAKLAAIEKKLRDSEDKLKDFGSENRIVNYYEQTRYIAQSKEDLEREIYRQKMTQNGGKDALTMIESKLNGREKQITNSQNMVTLRKHLSDVSAAVAAAQLSGNDRRETELKAKQKLVEDSLRKEIDTYNKLSYTTETVPRTDLVTSWVNNALEYDKATASLKVLEKQRDFYLDEMDQYAPLGSTLKRLERDVDINQGEYLATLHGLNQAKLRQNELELNASLKVLDKPFFPLTPQPSKRTILIVAGFLVTFLLVAFVTIGRDVIDSSLKTPERATQITGLPLVGVSLAPNNKKREAQYMDKLRRMLCEHFVNNVYLNLSATGNGQQTGNLRVALFATRSKVYDANSIKYLHQGIAELYDDVHWVVADEWADVWNAALPQKDFSLYRHTIKNLESESVDELVETDLSPFKLILFVMPDISHHGFPAKIIQKVSLSILVLNAHDTWLPADKGKLKQWREAFKDKKLFLWLTNSSFEGIDIIIGEVPRKRSWIRRKIKKIAALNFK